MSQNEDYGALLLRIPHADRLKVYKQMLEGREGSNIAGLQQQFIEQYADVTALEFQVDRCRERLESRVLSDADRTATQTDLNAMLLELARRQGRLDAIAHELKRINDAIEEINSV